MRGPGVSVGNPGEAELTVMQWQRELQVSSLVVSHDIRSVFRMAMRVVLLYIRRVHYVGTPEEMAASEDRYIRDFLGGY